MGTGKLDKKTLDKFDPKPTEVYSELKRPETQDERIRRIIREQIRPQDHGYETEEEAEDFDIEDDFEGELPISDDEFIEMRSEYPIVNEILNPTGSPDESDEVAQGDHSNPPGATGKDDDNERTGKDVDRNGA